jgi:hypothetical protein
MMTTMAAMFGALPLAIGMGVGSELRKPLGIAIVGGLIVSQMLTLYTTPVIYLWLDQIRQRWSQKRAGRAIGYPVKPYAACCRLNERSARSSPDLFRAKRRHRADARSATSG